MRNNPEFGFWKTMHKLPKSNFLKIRTRDGGNIHGPKWDYAIHKFCFSELSYLAFSQNIHPVLPH